MPTIYAKNHDAKVENFINNLDTRNKLPEFLVLAKTKTNYLLPIYISVRVRTNYILILLILNINYKFFSTYLQFQIICNL